MMAEFNLSASLIAHADSLSHCHSLLRYLNITKLQLLYWALEI